MNYSINIFDNNAMKFSEIVTKTYSTHITLSIKLLDKKHQSSIFAVYGLMRIGDEIVDTFLEKDRAALFQNFEQEVFQAIDDKFSLNPVLHSFQMVVNKYKIEKELITPFFSSMKMDLNMQLTTFTEEEFIEYYRGSAEAFFLICLKIICDGDDLLYNELREPTCRLGSALQKVNCLRDIKSDYEDRGRVYFPGINMNTFDENAKKAIEEDIQKDFDAAYLGNRKLPKGAASGVRFIYRFNKLLLNKIQGLSCASLMERRVKVSDWQKRMVYVSELLLNLFR